MILALHQLAMNSKLVSIGIACDPYSALNMALGFVNANLAD